MRNAATLLLALVTTAASATSPAQPPLAATVSAATRAKLDPILTASPQTEGMTLDAAKLPTRRAAVDAAQEAAAKIMLQRYDVSVADSVIAGVPVRVFAPRKPDPDRTRVLINLHGGGFVVDSGSLTENIPVAALTGLRVIAVRYRLAPEHPWPAALDDSVAVYREVLKTHRPRDIGLYGTSAGAILTAQSLVRLREEKLPQPAAAGFFSGTGDLATPGDSQQYLPPIGGASASLAAYIGTADAKDPRISPLHADLSGLPPVLCMTGTRDPLLSQTTLFHRALLRSAVTAELVVFEGMPHAHWSWLDIAESDEAFAIMARFFRERLGAAP